MWCEAPIIVCGVEAQLGVRYTSARHWDNKAFVTAASLLCTFGMITLALGYASLRGVLNELVWCCNGLCSITTTCGSICCIASGGATSCEDSCKLAVDTSQSFTDNSPSWKIRRKVLTARMNLGNIICVNSWCYREKLISGVLLNKSCKTVLQDGFLQILNYQYSYPC